jgi:predicted permease
MGILVNTVLPTVVPAFLIIFIGYMLGKHNQYDTKLLTDITIYVTLPCLILASLAGKWDTTFLLQEFAMIGAGALIVILGLGVAVFLYLKLARQEHLRIFYPSVMFLNAGNLALSLNLFAYGEDGFLRGMLFQVVNTSLMYSLGVYLVSKERNLASIFRIPFIYAAAAGVVLWAFHIELPPIVMRPIAFLGDAALPILLLMLGYELNQVRAAHFKLAMVGSLMRILGGFVLAAVFVLLLRAVGLTGDALSSKILIFNAAMPAAVGAFVLGKKFKADPDIAASIVLYTTLMGLVTIPVSLWWLELWF